MKKFEDYLYEMGYSWNDFDRIHEIEGIIEQYANERVNQALSRSNDSTSLIIRPNWKYCINEIPSNFYRCKIYRIIFKDIGNDNSIPTVGMGFRYADWNGEMFCNWRWKLDIMTSFDQCPDVNVLCWAEVEEIEIPDEFNENPD